MHEAFAAAIGLQFSASALETYHLVRLMRNSIIHAGGHASPQLASHCASLSDQADDAWSRMTGASIPRFTRGETIRLTHSELVATLAVTKRLARECNEALASHLPRTVWASVVVEDAQDAVSGRIRNPQQTMRALAGFARFNYTALQLSDEELRVAARDAGLSIK